MEEENEGETMQRIVIQETETYIVIETFEHSMRTNIQFFEKTPIIMDGIEAVIKAVEARV